MADLDDSLLKIANSPVLTQFLHDCVSDLAGAKQVNFDSYNSDIEWTVEDFTKAKTSIQKFYRETARTGNFELGTGLGPQAEGEIQNCYKIRKNEILDALVKENFMKNGHSLVENIDWKLKWVLGSSKLATIREPLLQVDLHCVKEDDEEAIRRERVNFEVNLDQLDSLINQLEHVNKEINNKSEL